MFFLSDITEFKRRKGSKNKRKKVRVEKEYDPYEEERKQQKMRNAQRNWALANSTAYQATRTARLVSSF